MKTIEEINERIKRGEAVVLTAEEFKSAIRGGEETREEDVDVVTTGTCGLMSGTAAILSVPVAERGKFERAKKCWLNGVPAFPGPCPNERLGLVDMIVYGSSSASPEYGGGHLFRELVEGREIEVRVETTDRKRIETEVTMEELPFARMFTTRSSFRNYMAFVNPKKGREKTIFSVSGLRGPYREATVSGCGEINPLENDPSLRTVGVGSRVLLNGAVGYVVGEGTRSSGERPNLSVVADMKGMRPEFMGGFLTSAGPECITSVAVPIPVLDAQVLSHLRVLDQEIGLPVAAIQDRSPFEEDRYASLWQGVDLEIKFEGEKCCGGRCSCKKCPIEMGCPTRAFSRLRGIDKSRCFDCGFCVTRCLGKAFSGRLGSLKVKGREVPITLRQSNRRRAGELSRLLKEKILEREFWLSEPVAPLR